MKPSNYFVKIAQLFVYKQVIISQVTSVYNSTDNWMF